MSRRWVSYLKPDVFKIPTIGSWKVRSWNWNTDVISSREPGVRRSREGGRHDQGGCGGGDCFLRSGKGKMDQSCKYYK